MSKPSKKRNERIRKIGEREESIVHELSAKELSDRKDDVMDLLEEVEKIEERKKEQAKNYASQLSTLELQIGEMRREIKSGKRSQTVLIQEFLTASNEVIRVRADTDEQIGIPRTATARELQEELPLDAAAETNEEAVDFDVDHQADSEADIPDPDAAFQ